MVYALDSHGAPPYNATIMKSLILASFFLTLPTFGLAAPSAEPTEQTEESIAIDVTLPVGGVYNFLLKGNPTTGYTWNATVTSGDAVRVETEVMEPKEEEDGPILCGAPSPTKVTFTAEKSGDSVIVLEYKRAWETGKPAAKTITCKVTVAAE